MVDEEYAGTLRRLYALRRFGMRPGLETIRALLHGLGDPQESFTALHLTGSKGKGSTAAMAASVLAATGARTGLFTSPHLVSYRERIRVDGEPIPPEAVVEGFRTIADVAERLQRAGTLAHEPTFFEYTTALGFQRFRDAGVELAVVEVGLGGRLDATNVLRAPVAGITTLELEHTDVLGPTLTDIAREKAGILHAGQHAAVVGELPPEGRAEVDARADALGVPVWHLGEEVLVTDRELSPKGQTLAVALPHRQFAKLRIPLQGVFQPGNAALAVAAVDRLSSALGRPLHDAAVRKGLAAVRWRGRLERLETDPDLFVDVAHTPESARALARSLAEIAPLAVPSDSAILFGCLAEKRVEEILEALAPLAETLVLVPVASSRSAPLPELRRAAHGRFPRIVQAEGALEGLALARAATGEAGFTLVAGSDYLVGELLRRREKVAPEEPDLSDPGLGAPAGPAPMGAGGRRP